MIELYKKFKTKGFTVIGINIKETKETIKKYVDKSNMLFPVLLDTQGDVADKYKIQGFPAHILIDGNGDIKAFTTGARDFTSKESHAMIQFMIDNNK